MKLRPTKCTECRIDPEIMWERQPYVNPGETIKRHQYYMKIICVRCLKDSASQDPDQVKAYRQAVYRWETSENRTKVHFEDCVSCRIPPVLEIELKEIQHHKDFFELTVTCPVCAKAASYLEIGLDRTIELISIRWREINEI